MRATPQRRRQNRSRVTRERLVASGFGLFAEVGFDAVTVDDVCSAAGVAKGTFYFHFDSKEALLVAAFHQGGGALLELAEALVASNVSFDVAVLSLGERVAAATSPHPKALVRRATVAALAAIDLERPPDGAQARRAAFGLVVESAIRAGDVAAGFRPDEITMALNWSMLQALLVWSAQPGERPSLATVMRRSLLLALGGVRQRNPEPG